MKFKVKKNVTLPTLSLAVNQVAFVRFDEAIYVGKEVEAKEGEKKKEPPSLACVTDMETGEQRTLILNTVLVSTIDEAYPAKTYVGKIFRVEKLAKRAGKDYHDFKIQEVEAEADAATPPSAATEASNRAFDQPHHGHDSEAVIAKGGKQRAKA